MMEPFIMLCCFVMALCYCFTEYKKGPCGIAEFLREQERLYIENDADRMLYKVDPQLAIDLGFDPTTVT